MGTCDAEAHIKSRLTAPDILVEEGRVHQRVVDTTEGSGLAGWRGGEVARWRGGEVVREWGNWMVGPWAVGRKP